MVTSPVSSWRTQRLKCASTELWSLVRKEHASVGQRDDYRPRHPGTTDQCGNGRIVVRMEYGGRRIESP